MMDMVRRFTAYEEEDCDIDDECTSGVIALKVNNSIYELCRPTLPYLGHYKPS